MKTTTSYLITWQYGHDEKSKTETPVEVDIFISDKAPQRYENVNLYGYEFPLLAGYDNEGFEYRNFKPAQELKFPLMKYSKVIEEELVSAN